MQPHTLSQIKGFWCKEVKKLSGVWLKELTTSVSIKLVPRFWNLSVQYNTLLSIHVYLSLFLSLYIYRSRSVSWINVSKYDTKSGIDRDNPAKTKKDRARPSNRKFAVDFTPDTEIRFGSISLDFYHPIRF